MVKIFDQDVFGELLVIDDGGGLAHHEVAEDFLILELLALSQVLFQGKEGQLAGKELLGVAAAKGKGGLCKCHPPLGKLAKLLGDMVVEPGEEEHSPEQELQPHVGRTSSQLELGIYGMERWEMGGCVVLCLLFLAVDARRTHRP